MKRASTQFSQAGFLVRCGAISVAKCIAVTKEMSPALDDTAPPGQYQRIDDVCDVVPLAARLAFQHSLVDVVATLLGPAVAFVDAKYHHGSPVVGWHRDFCSYPHTTADLLTVEIWLTAATRVHGALAVLPGSHRGDTLRRYPLVLGQTIELLPQDLAASQVLEVNTGDVTFHHSLLLHRVVPSCSSYARNVLICTYRSASARLLVPRQSNSIYAGRLLRGVEPVTYDVEPGVAVAESATQGRFLRIADQRCGMM
jgi:hypothetical protein